jgi:hypothetical protein
MRTKTLVVLAGLTLATGAGAFYATHQRNAPDASAAVQNQPVLPGLAARIDGLARVEIERGGAAFALQRGADGNWSLPGKADYPVAFEPVRRLALDMASLRILEARTANPALHGEIDLDGAGADQKATRVTLFGPDGQTLASLLVGRTRFGRQGTAGDGTFVRLAGQNQVWLAQGRVSVEREAARWLDRRLADVARERIASARIVAADGKYLAVSRDKPADEDFALADLPRGKKIKSAFDVNLVASALEGLELEDVRKADGLAFAADADYSEYRSFDGLVVRAQRARDGSDVWVRFAARFEPAAARDPLPEDAKLKSADDVAKEAAALNARTAGWAYRLPGYKIEYMTRSVADLVEDKTP